MLALPALHRSTEWRETSFRSMAARDWGPVEQAIFETVSGVRPLPGDDDMVYENCLIPLPTGDVPRENQFVRGQRVRHTWALTIAYSGCHFSGYAWQKDAPKPTVAGCLQDAIEPLLHGEHSLRLACAGRTDAGVSALAQRVSFWCWPELDAQAIASAVAAAAPQPGALRVLSAAHSLDKTYHATFATTWRRYAYLLPPMPGASREEVEAEARDMDGMLSALAGAPRDYAALARGVPKGKDTTTTLFHASARVVSIGGGDGSIAAPAGLATRVDLVGDRFLRRQVRTLVATVAATTSMALARDREALTTEVERAERCQTEPQAAALAPDGEAEGVSAAPCEAGAPASSPSEASEASRPASLLPVLDAAGRAQALLDAVTSGEQYSTAHPAPPEGLIFAAAGGEDEAWAWMPGLDDGEPAERVSVE